MAIKKGDILVCINPNHAITAGKQYIALADEVERRGEMYVRIESDRGVKEEFYTYRFEVAPAIMPRQAPAVGMRVRCLKGIRGALIKGRMYTIKSIGPKTGVICVEGVAGRSFSPDRFEYPEAIPVGNPAVPFVPRAFKNGDKVICVKLEDNAFGWNAVMESNVIEHKILTVYNVNGGGVVQNREYAALDRGYIYPRDSLIFADTLLFENAPADAKPYDLKNKPKEEPAKPPAPDRLDKLRKKIGGYDVDYLNTFGYLLKGHDDPVHHLSAPCYAQAQHKPEGAMEAFVFSINNANRYLDGGSKEMFKRWADYVLHHSPVSDVFVQEDWDTYTKLGVVCDVNKTLSQICTAAIWVREGYEFSDMLPTFCHFVDQGYGENTAFLMAHVVQHRKGEAKESFTKIAFGDRGHKGISGYANYKDTIKFFQQGFHVDLGDKPANERIGRYQIFNSIAKQHGESFDEVATKMLPKEVVGTGFEKVSVLTDKTVYDFAEFLNKQIN